MPDLHAARVISFTRQHIIWLLYLTIFAFLPSIISNAQTDFDLDARYDDDESFVFAYPSSWDLTTENGVEITGIVDEVKVTMSFESVPVGEFEPSITATGDDALSDIAERYALDDEDEITLDDRRAIIGIVETETTAITVIILRTNYDPRLDAYVAIFITTDSDNGIDDVEDTVLAITSTVIERDAASVLTVPQGLGGIVSGSGDDEMSSSVRALAGDNDSEDDEETEGEEEENETDDEGSRGIGDFFGDDDDDD